MEYLPKYYNMYQSLEREIPSAQVLITFLYVCNLLHILLILHLYS